MANRQELETAIRKAGASGDTTELLKLAGQLEDLNKLEAKANRERAEKERTGVILAITEDVRSPVQKHDAKVKALGGVLRITRDLNQDPPLLHVVIGEKAAAKGGSGGGGRATGNAMERFGKPLAAIYEEHATAEERASFAAAEGNNSKQWQIKTAVMKRAEGAGDLKPVS